MKKFLCLRKKYGKEEVAGAIRDDNVWGRRHGWFSHLAHKTNFVIQRAKYYRSRRQLLAYFKSLFKDVKRPKRQDYYLYNKTKFEFDDEQKTGLIFKRKRKIKRKKKDEHIAPIGG